MIAVPPNTAMACCAVQCVQQRFQQHMLRGAPPHTGRCSLLMRPPPSPLRLSRGLPAHLPPPVPHCCVQTEHLLKPCLTRLQHRPSIAGMSPACHPMGGLVCCQLSASPLCLCSTTDAYPPAETFLKISAQLLSYLSCSSSSVSGISRAVGP